MVVVVRMPEAQAAVATAAVATVVTAVEEAAERLSDEAKVTKTIEIAMRYDLIEIEVEAVHMIEGTTVENDQGVGIVIVVARGAKTEVVDDHARRAEILQHRGRWMSGCSKPDRMDCEPRCS